MSNRAARKRPGSTRGVTSGDCTAGPPTSCCPHARAEPQLGAPRKRLSGMTTTLVRIATSRPAVDLAVRVVVLILVAIAIFVGLPVVAALAA